MKTEDEEKRSRMADDFEKIILKYLVPISKGRNFERNRKTTNKNHINK